jgi:hypothetical protein
MVARVMRLPKNSIGNAIIKLPKMPQSGGKDAEKSQHQQL